MSEKNWDFASGNICNGERRNKELDKGYRRLKLGGTVENEWEIAVFLFALQILPRKNKHQMEKGKIPYFPYCNSSMYLLQSVYLVQYRYT